MCLDCFDLLAVKDNSQTQYSVDPYAVMYRQICILMTGKLCLLSLLRQGEMGVKLFSALFILLTICHVEW